jgi:outer membrane protein OmpA-like peptidoglycan-associated protein
MYYRLVLSFAFVSLSWITIAQNKYVLEAETYFASGKYCEGAEKCGLAYSKLTRKGNQAKKMKADMAFKTAECYRFTDHFREANEWYDRALLLDYQDVVPEVLYYNGEMLRMMGEFDKALKNYEEYKNLVPSDTRADNGIQSCQGSKNFVANKTKHVITNQTAINKNEFDMSPMFQDRKETKLYFASSRPGSTGSATDPIACESYMDIWVSEIDKKGNWGQPVLVDNSGLINTEAHEGSVAFDGRGKTMFFTRCPMLKKQNLGCDIWMSELKGQDKWDEPVKLDLKGGVDSVSVGHPCVSDDGKFLIFASDMAGGYGGRDLWYTTFDKKTGWAAPKNMGPEVNTAGNELFPTFGKDGSLFYSSDGKPGLGGLDLFKATKVGTENKWENATNLGFPINSENNDYGLYELTDKKGYFTSERKTPSGKFNADIYSYVLPPNIFDLKVIVSELGNTTKKIADVTVVAKGSDGSTWEGKTNKSGSVFWDKKTDATRYINQDVEYSINVSKEGYHENKKPSQFTTLGLDEDQSFIIDMALLPKKPIRLPEVRYPLNQWTLLVDSTINSPDSLMFVYNLLQEYPEMVLELSSHTDSRGKNEANQKLSENRAKACYKYLVEQKGVDPRRIIPVGKGEMEPRTVYKSGDVYLADQPNDMTGVETILLTEAYINQFKAKNKQLYETLHQLNRRTEGKVVNMGFDPATAPAANPGYLQFVKYP